MRFREFGEFLTMLTIDLRGTYLVDKISLEIKYLGDKITKDCR